MDVEAEGVSGCSHREVIVMEESDEVESNAEEHNTEMPNKEPYVNKRTQGGSGTGPEFHGSLTTGCLPAFPVCEPQDKLTMTGEDENTQDNLLHLCCTAGGSIDQRNPTLEYLLYLDNQHDRPASHSVSLETDRPHLSTSHASSVSSTVSATVSNSSIDPFSALSSPWDTSSSTSRTSLRSYQDPVSAAAHLHLLGESLSLIGHHLQETNKMVCISSSCSLLLDSLLCALAPLICLTTQIPELRSCTQGTLASTLENISYVMPGL